LFPSLASQCYEPSAAFLLYTRIIQPEAFGQTRSYDDADSPRLHWFQVQALALQQAERLALFHVEEKNEGPSRSPVPPSQSNRRRIVYRAAQITGKAPRPRVRPHKRHPTALFAMHESA
jgi:hypothetical protein